MSDPLKQIRREGRIILSEIRNPSAESRKQLCGYELAVMQQKEIKGGMEEYYPKESEKPRARWFYLASELRCAHQGFETLNDAQSRNVLGDRSKW